MTKRFIAFFDIDGTLTSEVDGTIPDSCREAIRKARENGHLMFLNTGRCFQNVEQVFREVGFDGYVCGCGTHVVLEKKDCPFPAGEEGTRLQREGVDEPYYEHPLYVTRTPEQIARIREVSRLAQVDTLFECRKFVTFDNTRPVLTAGALRQKNSFLSREYDMNTDVDAADFACDKFVVWYEREEQLRQVREVSDAVFECIDRGGTFREFVPKGYSKATGIQWVLDYYGIPLENAYCFGDSNNDLAMLSYVPNSVAMGNCEPEDLKEKVSFVTAKASEDGIAKALKVLGFLD